MARNGKLDALKPSMNGDIDKKKKKKKAAPRKAIPDAQVFLSYMPKLVDNMFGEGEKSYTLRSSTSRALSGLLGQLETTLTNDAKRVATFQKKKSILPTSVQVAVATRLPRPLAELAASEAAGALRKFQAAKKEKMNGSGK